MMVYPVFVIKLNVSQSLVRSEDKRLLSGQWSGAAKRGIK
jgi:hypothetical protein